MSHDNDLTLNLKSGQNWKSAFFVSIFSEELMSSVLHLFLSHAIIYKMMMNELLLILLNLKRVKTFTSHV